MLPIRSSSRNPTAWPNAIFQRKHCPPTSNAANSGVRLLTAKTQPLLPALLRLLSCRLAPQGCATVRRAPLSQWLHSVASIRTKPACRQSRNSSWAARTVGWRVGPAPPRGDHVRSDHETAATDPAALLGDKARPQRPRSSPAERADSGPASAATASSARQFRVSGAAETLRQRSYSMRRNYCG
jgi:hypothetical protein